MPTPEFRPASAPWRRAAWLGLAFALAACGGGGGGGAVTDPTAPPPPSTTSLQAHLAQCANGQVFNDRIPCMTGIYEGTTPGTGASCAFRYDNEGIAHYLAGDRTLRVSLSLTASGAVFTKTVANTPSGFSIGWAIGIASGREVDIDYQASDEPGSANGLFVQPRNTAIAPCLITTGPTNAATASASTRNDLGRDWQAPQPVASHSGAGLVDSVAGQPPFDSGMADDGRAFVAYRQPQGDGRIGLYVVEGRPGAAGQAAAWGTPRLLDADVPTLSGNSRPRIAVSATGHAVVAWLTQRPCDADSYEAQPAGKNCRYVHAARRLATDADWEPARRVAASRPMTAHDHLVHINAQGDVVLAFQGFVAAGSTSTETKLAVRRAGDAAFRTLRIAGFRSNDVTPAPMAQQLHLTVDDAGNVFAAGVSTAFFSDLARTRSTMAQLSDPATTVLPETLPRETGIHVFDIATSGGYAAYVSKHESGPYNPLKPERMTVYSPATQQWLASDDLTRYALWGDAAFVGTPAANGEFLLYAGCKVTAWRAGAWGTTTALPAYCGRDRSGGLYAFNHHGDYVGLHWAGQPGQWGFYSRAQNQLLKGAPGNGTAVAGDLLLGTASNLFGANATQLMLAPNGLALAITANTHTALPSAANAAGVDGGAGLKLWGVYLK